MGAFCPPKSKKMKETHPNKFSDLLSFYFYLFIWPFPENCQAFGERETYYKEGEEKYIY